MNYYCDNIESYYGKQKNYKIETTRPKGFHDLPWSQLVTLLSRVHVWANAYLIIFNL